MQFSITFEAEKWFEKYGDKIILFGRMVPVMRELVSIPAGILKMKPLKFMFYTFIGSCIWSISVILAGYYFGASVFTNM